jgi:hypothetical protein
MPVAPSSFRSAGFEVRSMRVCSLLFALALCLSPVSCATGVEDDGTTQPSGSSGTAGAGAQGGSAGSEGGAGGADSSPDSATDAPDVLGDRPADASTDQATDKLGDSPGDAKPDAGQEAAADADAAAQPDADATADKAPEIGPDVPGDVQAEVATDVAKDIAPDVPAETAPDAPADAVSEPDAKPDTAPPDAGGDAEAGVVKNDTCPGEPLALAGSGQNPRVGTASGDTSGLLAEYSGTGSCSPSNGRDAVYSFTPDVDGIATLELTTSFDAMLYVRTTCTSAASQTVCKDSLYAPGTESVRFWATAGTTYYVFADAYSGTAKGTFTLKVTVEPAVPAEKCPGAPVPWVGSGTQDRTASVTGDTANRWSDHNSAACGAASAPDAVYAFTPDVDGLLSLTLAPQGWDAAMYVRTTCATPSTELTCQDPGGSGTAEKWQAWATAGTTYYVFVDGSYNSSAGPYTLSAVLTPQKPNEKCPGEAAVWTGSGNNPRTFQATDDTSKHWSDHNSAACGSATARDTVYALTPDVDGIMTVDVTPTGWDAALYLRTTCAQAGTELACHDSGGSGGKETHVMWATAGTTVYAFVDGSYSTSAGPYTFNARLAPKLPADQCPGEPITLSGTPPSGQANGNTGDLWSDYNGSCNSSGRPDGVYQVVAPQTGNLKITLTPTGFDAVLYVRSANCATGTQLACRDLAGSGQAEAATVAVTQGTTYYIFVDAFGSATGAYTLAVGY